MPAQLANPRLRLCRQSIVARSCRYSRHTTTQSMQILLSVLILAVAPAAATTVKPAASSANSVESPAAVLLNAPTDEVSTTGRPPDAVEVFHCGFEPESDPDYDMWPEGWTRVRDARHPLYLPVQIV